MTERTHRNYLTVATAVFTVVALAGVLADAYRPLHQLVQHLLIGRVP